MNKKEAEEIIVNHKCSVIDCGIPEPGIIQFSRAKGYLEALKGPEVSILVEALELVNEVWDRINAWEDNNLGDDEHEAWVKVKKALAQYKDAVKEK